MGSFIPLYAQVLLLPAVLTIVIMYPVAKIYASIQSRKGYDHVLLTCDVGIVGFLLLGALFTGHFIYIGPEALVQSFPKELFNPW